VVLLNAASPYLTAEKKLVVVKILTQEKEDLNETFF
jgi:hypothetical protein